MINLITLETFNTLNLVSYDKEILLNNISILLQKVIREKLLYSSYYQGKYFLHKRIEIFF